MPRLVVLYRNPENTSAFDSYYTEVHIPLAKKIPGLRKYEVSKGPVVTPHGPSDFHLVATLHFDSMGDIQNAFASSEGQAAAGDLKNFASGGADLLIFDSRDV
jgi:uncharacterized protein (TIGR02118 family)